MFNRAWTSMDLAYPQLIGLVKEHGTRAMPRGKRCIEVRPATFSIARATECLYKNTDRRLNYAFLAAEALSYIGGSGDAWVGDCLVMLNREMRNYQTNGRFLGAYGPRTHDTLAKAVELLLRDKDTRQCHISIWKPEAEWEQCGPDVPCTTGWTFYSNYDHDNGICLDMTAQMRSNDLNWGTPYDVACFACVQAALAECVMMRPGAYHHYASSLHVYEDTLPKFSDGGETDLHLNIPTGHGFFGRNSWEYLSKAATDMLEELYLHLHKGGITDEFEFTPGLTQRLDSRWAHQWERLIQTGRPKR